MTDAPDERPPQETALAERGKDGPVRFSLPDGQTVDLGRLYQGRACFLALAGPSLADANLELLRGPGVVTLGVNNAWSVLRPRLWCCVDPIGRFVDKGFRDPAVLKLLPLSHANQRLRFRKDGVWKLSQWRARDCPNTLFWQANSTFEPCDFFAEPSVCVGMRDGETDSCGVKGHRSVMLAAIKLAYALGFRTLYLVGCDWRMRDGQQNYAFEQGRDRRTVVHNESLYAAIGRRLAALVPYMEGEGMRIFNCTNGSGLAAFPYKRLSDAVREATVDCAGAMDPDGYYDGAQPDPVEFLRKAGE